MANYRDYNRHSKSLLRDWEKMTNWERTKRILTYPPTIVIISILVIILFGAIMKCNAAEVTVAEKGTDASEYVDDSKQWKDNYVILTDEAQDEIAKKLETIPFLKRKIELQQEIIDTLDRQVAIQRHLIAECENDLGELIIKTEDFKREYEKKYNFWAEFRRKFTRKFNVGCTFGFDKEIEGNVTCGLTFNFL